MNGIELPNEVLQKKIDSLLPLFNLHGSKLLYEGKLCVPRNAISTVLELAHDAKSAGHFGYIKTLSRFGSYLWKNKAKDVKNYVKGCLVCQQKKHHLGQKLKDPSSLEVPERRWSSLASDFIVKLSRTKNGFDTITTYVDRLS